MIRAECHTDDMNAAAKFDATPWFETASEQDIVDLADTGWGGDYEADRLAREFSEMPGYEGVAEVFRHVEERGVGFESHVHSSDAVSWLRVNRPAAYENLVSLMLVERAGNASKSPAPAWDNDPSWPTEYDVPVMSGPKA